MIRKTLLPLVLAPLALAACANHDQDAMATAQQAQTVAQQAQATAQEAQATAQQALATANQANAKADREFQQNLKK